MLGFKPVGHEAAAGVEGALQEVDRQLESYQEAWDSLVDSWLVIRIADPQVGARCVLVSSSMCDSHSVRSSEVSSCAVKPPSI